MPLAPKDMENLLTALNRNTAAILTVAVMLANHGKPGNVPQKSDRSIIEGIFDDYSNLL